MVGASQVVPQAIVVVQHAVVVAVEIVDHRIEAVGESCALTSGHETGDGRSGTFIGKALLGAAVPPGDGIAVAHDEPAVAGDMPVGHGILVVGFHRLWHIKLTAFDGVDVLQTVWGHLSGIGHGVYPHLQGEPGLLHRHAGHDFCLFHGGTAGGLGVSRQHIAVDGSLAHTFLQLVVEQTAGLHMVVAVGPLGISRQGGPAAVGTVAVVGIGGIVPQGGSRALPHHAVGGVPSGACAELLQVLEADVVALDVHDVEEQTGGPRAYTAAEA